MLSGTLEYGEVFEVLIPAKERPMGVRSKIVDRDAIVVRAHIQDACGRRFLVAVQANPVGDVDDWTWKLLRDNYAMFVANIKWPR
jgi:hypothetical protein